MKINIVSANVFYRENEVTSAQVYFEGVDELSTVQINGHKTLTSEEYEANKTPVQLKEIIKQSLVDYI